MLFSYGIICESARGATMAVRLTRALSNTMAVGITGALATTGALAATGALGTIAALSAFGNNRGLGFDGKLDSIGHIFPHFGSIQMPCQLVRQPFIFFLHKAQAGSTLLGVYCT